MSPPRHEAGLAIGGEAGTARRARSGARAGGATGGPATGRPPVKYFSDRREIRFPAGPDPRMRVTYRRMLTNISGGTVQADVVPLDWLPTGGAAGIDPSTLVVVTEPLHSGSQPQPTAELLDHPAGEGLAVAVGFRGGLLPGASDGYRLEVTAPAPSAFTDAREHVLRIHRPTTMLSCVVHAPTGRTIADPRARVHHGGPGGASAPGGADADGLLAWPHQLVFERLQPPHEAAFTITYRLTRDRAPAQDRATAPGRVSGGAR